MKKLSALVLAAALSASVASTANAQPVPASLAGLGAGVTTTVIIGGVLFVVTIASIINNDGPAATTTN